MGVFRIHVASWVASSMIKSRSFIVDWAISAISCCGFFTDSATDELLEFLFQTFTILLCI